MRKTGYELFQKYVVIPNCLQFLRPLDLHITFTSVTEPKQHSCETR